MPVQARDDLPSEKFLQSCEQNSRAGGGLSLDIDCNHHVGCNLALVGLAKVTTQDRADLFSRRRMVEHLIQATGLIDHVGIS